MDFNLNTYISCRRLSKTRGQERAQSRWIENMKFNRNILSTIINICLIMAFSLNLMVFFVDSFFSTWFFFSLRHTFYTANASTIRREKNKISKKRTSKNDRQAFHSKCWFFLVMIGFVTLILSNRISSCKWQRLEAPRDTWQFWKRNHFFHVLSKVKMSIVRSSRRNHFNCRNKSPKYDKKERFLIRFGS